MRMTASSPACPRLDVEQLLGRLTRCYRLRDRHGLALLGHLVVRRADGGLKGVTCE